MHPAALDDPESAEHQAEALKAAYVAAVGEATRRVLGGSPSAEGVEDLATLVASYADREVAEWRGRPESPPGVACRAGCSYCCHYPVAATVPEVIRIAAAIRSEAELARLREKVEAHDRARSEVEGPGRDRVPIACPLLDQGRCSAYEMRPLTCRGWTSLDASRCEAFYREPAVDPEIPVDGVQHAIARGIALGIQGGLRSEGLSAGFVELVPALRIALEDPSAIDRWLAGEPAFRDAERPEDTPPAAP